MLQELFLSLQLRTAYLNSSTSSSQQPLPSPVEVVERKLPIYFDRKDFVIKTEPKMSTSSLLQTAFRDGYERRMLSSNSYVPRPKYDRKGFSRQTDFTSAFMRGVV